MTVPDPVGGIPWSDLPSLRLAQAHRGRSPWRPVTDAYDVDLAGHGWQLATSAIVLDSLTPEERVELGTLLSRTKSSLNRDEVAREAELLGRCPRRRPPPVDLDPHGEVPIREIVTLGRRLVPYLAEVGLGEPPVLPTGGSGVHLDLGHIEVEHPELLRGVGRLVREALDQACEDGTDVPCISDDRGVDDRRSSTVYVDDTLYGHGPRGRGRMWALTGDRRGKAIDARADERRGTEDPDAIREACEAVIRQREEREARRARERRRAAQTRRRRREAGEDPGPDDIDAFVDAILNRHVGREDVHDAIVDAAHAIGGLVPRHLAAEEAERRVIDALAREGRADDRRTVREMVARGAERPWDPDARERRGGIPSSDDAAGSAPADEAPPVPLDEAEDRIAGWWLARLDQARQALTDGEAPEPEALSSTPGVGKTTAGLRAIARAHRGGEGVPVLWAAPTHEALREAAAVLRAEGIEPWTYRGPAAPDPNDPDDVTCEFPGRLAAWDTPPEWSAMACIGCSMAAGCAARESIPADPVVLVTHTALAHVPALRKEAARRLLVIDESPDLTDEVQVGASKLDRWTAAHYGRKAEQDGRAPAVRRTLRTLQDVLHAATAEADGQTRSWVGPEVADLVADDINLDALRRAAAMTLWPDDERERWPIPHPETVRGEGPPEAWGADPDEVPRAEIRDLADAVAAAVTDDEMDGRLAVIVTDGSRSIRFVRRPDPPRGGGGTLLLDATAHLSAPELRALLAADDLGVETVRAADAHPGAVMRLHRESGMFTRRRLRGGRGRKATSEGARRLERLVDLAAKEAKDHLGDDPTIGLITYEPEARDLVERHPDWTVGWYGAHDRSLNAFEDVDLLAVVGDAYPNLDAVRRRSALLDLIEDAAKTAADREAAANVTQAIGRLRAVRREDPAAIVVACSTPPPPWIGRGDIVRLKDPADPRDADVTLADLLEAAEVALQARGVYSPWAPGQLASVPMKDLSVGTDGNSTTGQDHRLRATLDDRGYPTRPWPTDLLREVAPGRGGGPRPTYYHRPGLENPDEALRGAVRYVLNADPLEGARDRSLPAFASNADIVDLSRLASAAARTKGVWIPGTSFRVLRREAVDADTRRVVEERSRADRRAIRGTARALGLHRVKMGRRAIWRTPDLSDPEARTRAREVIEQSDHDPNDEEDDPDADP